MVFKYGCLELWLHKRNVYNWVKPIMTANPYLAGSSIQCNPQIHEAIVCVFNTYTLPNYESLYKQSGRALTQGKLIGTWGGMSCKEMLTRVPIPPSIKSRLRRTWVIDTWLKTPRDANGACQCQQPGSISIHHMETLCCVYALVVAVLLLAQVAHLF